MDPRAEPGHRVVAVRQVAAWWPPGGLQRPAGRRRWGRRTRRRSERGGAAGARAMSGRRRRSRRRRRRVARRRPLRGVEVRGLGEFGQVALELGGLDGKRGALLGAASLPAPLEGAARATSPARVIMHVGSPDAARAQDVASRWSRRARSWRRACRDGRSHRGRGARPHDRARRDKRDGQREPRGRRHRG